MNDIAKIDKNFEVKKADENGIVYYNCLDKPFKIYGLILPDEKEPFFKRMPTSVAKSTSEGVFGLYARTAGGRVRFVTDSQTVAIKATLPQISRMSHFPLTGSAGFDIYEGTSYFKTFVPPIDIKDAYSSSVKFPTKKERVITINFPLYSSVSSLKIGLEEGCFIKQAPEYKTAVPVVYYGSSITQGGCASRPGTCYQNIITRELDCDHINLGFSGNAKAEDVMAQYIAGLEMSAFVYDYDHNAPNVEHLKATHEKMFLTIRKANPTLPIIMVSRPQNNLDCEEYTRRAVIMQTYLNAKNAGDNNVYFVDGSVFFDIFGGDNCTVDNCHPNDLGFMCMATSIGEQLKKVL